MWSPLIATCVWLCRPHTAKESTASIMTLPAAARVDEHSTPAFLDLNEPSPTTSTTERDGAASFTPSAKPMPRPSPPQERKKLCGMCTGRCWRTGNAAVMLSSAHSCRRQMLWPQCAADYKFKVYVSKQKRQIMWIFDRCGARSPELRELEDRAAQQVRC